MIPTRRAAIAWAVATFIPCAMAAAQQVDRLPVVGLLVPGSEQQYLEWVQELRDGLKQYGLVDGRSMRLVIRYAEETPDRIAGIAKEFAAMGSRVIVTWGTTYVQAAHEALPTMPIVMAGSADPVAVGLARSLARPGGSITGISIMGGDLIGKQIELLKEVVPAARAFAGLLQAANPGNAVFRDALDNAGRAQKIPIHVREIRGTDDIAGTFEWAAGLPVDGVFVIQDPVFLRNRDTIVSHAMRHGLPIVAGVEQMGTSGALLVYGPDRSAIRRRAGFFVAAILRGVDPGTLPIEQPTDFRLWINLKTARSLGLAIPATLLARDHDVID